MNHSFGAWMLTGGTRGEFGAEARQLEHLRAFRELESDRRSARRAERMTTLTTTLDALRARIMGRTIEITPDCCPA